MPLVSPWAGPARRVPAVPGAGAEGVGYTRTSRSSLSVHSLGQLGQDTAVGPLVQVVLRHALTEIGHARGHQRQLTARGVLRAQLRYGEPGHVDGQEPDEPELAADVAPVTGDLTGRPQLVDLVGGRAWPQGPGDPDAVTVVADGDVRHGGARVVVVIARRDRKS